MTGGPVDGIGVPLATHLGWFAEGDVTELVETYRRHNHEVHDRMVAPFPGVTELVRSLRARRAVVTTKGRRGALRGIASLGLADVIETLVALEDVTRPKPDPEPVAIALARLGVRPDRAVFVGDSVHDVACGVAAGVRTIAVSWGSTSAERLAAAGPDCVVHDAAALAVALGAG